MKQQQYQLQIELPNLGDTLLDILELLFMIDIEFETSILFSVVEFICLNFQLCPIKYLI